MKDIKCTMNLLELNNGKLDLKVLQQKLNAIACIELLNECDGLINKTDNTSAIGFIEHYFGIRTNGPDNEYIDVTTNLPIEVLLRYVTHADYNVLDRISEDEDKMTSGFMKQNVK